MFSKFYLGILIAVMFAVSINYVFYNYTFSDKASVYQSSALGGSLNLISNTLQSLEQDKQEDYLNIALTLLGASIVSNAAERGGVDSNPSLKNVTTLIKHEGNSSIWKLPIGNSNSVLVSFPDVSEQQFRAHALLLVSHYKGVLLNENFKQLQMYSDYELALISIDKVSLDPQQKQDLRNKRVVVKTSETVSEFSVYAPVDDAQVLRVGPIKSLEPLSMETGLRMVAITVVIFVVVAYWIITVLASRIKPIDIMVDDVGAGNLQSRINVKGNDHFSRLSQRINDMAARIGSLMDTQKGIMQAVSHELRTPLSRMRFKLAALEEELAENNDQNSTSIRKDIDDIEALIDEILEYHKLSQQPVFSKEPVNILQLTQGIMENLKHLHNNLEIDLFVDEGLVFMSDKRSMQRLLENLMSNACKHAVSKVKVQACLDNDFLQFDVQDDGKGIEDEFKTTVFEAFYRDNNVVNQKMKGYGLGLAIVKRLVKLYEGTIIVEDSSLGGAKFTVHLPFKSSATDES